MKIAHASFTAVMIALGGPCFGGPDSYYCESKYQVDIAADGKPQVRNLEPPNTTPSINRFSVDRKTGKKIGGSFGSFRDQVGTLLSPGNSSSAFIVSWVGPAAGGGSHLDILRIEEFQAGPRKPFTAHAGGTIYTGVCE